MAILIQASNIGADAGPFNLFSQVDGFTEAFEIDVTSNQLLAGFVSYNVPFGTAVVRIISNSPDCNTYIDKELDAAPNCPNNVTVFQVCNENAFRDDNFDVFLNGSLIGNLDLNQDAQVGSIFVASNTPLVITEPDFPCPLSNMQLFFFDPDIITLRNTVQMINTQNNGNGNQGTLSIRNYEISGNTLINPCVIEDIEWDGPSGLDFEFSWIYDACCGSDVEIE